MNLNIIYQSNLQVSSKSAFKNKKRKEAAKAARLAEAAIPAQTCCINNNKNIVHLPSIWLIQLDKY